jgi:hypothetical protein
MNEIVGAIRACNDRPRSKLKSHDFIGENLQVIRYENFSMLPIYFALQVKALDAPLAYLSRDRGLVVHRVISRAVMRKLSGSAKLNK